jgi:hypothetical protein
VPAEQNIETKVDFFSLTPLSRPCWSIFSVAALFESWRGKPRESCSARRRVVGWRCCRQRRRRGGGGDDGEQVVVVGVLLHVSIVGFQVSQV